MMGFVRKYLTGFSCSLFWHKNSTLDVYNGPKYASEDTK